MNPEYTDVTQQEAGHAAANLGISGRPEALMEFVLWIWRRALADRAAREAALGRMVANVEELGLYNELEKAE